MSRRSLVVRARGSARVSSGGGSAAVPHTATLPSVAPRAVLRTDSHGLRRDTGVADHLRDVESPSRALSTRFTIHQASVALIGRLGLRGGSTPLRPGASLGRLSCAAPRFFV